MQERIAPRQQSDYYTIMPDWENPGKWKLIRIVMRPVSEDIGKYNTQEEAQKALERFQKFSWWTTEIKY